METQNEVHRETIMSLKQRISKLIEQKRRSDVEVYYISQLGSDLGVSSAKIESISGYKLVDFVKQELGYRVASATHSANTAPFIYFSLDAPKPNKRMRFAKPFWEAFSSTSEEARFLRVTDLRFGPASEIIRLYDGVFEIEPEFQPRSDADRAADVTSLRIQRWLREKGLGAEAFSEELLRKTDPIRPSKANAGETVLERLVNALTDDERAALSLPVTVTHALASLRIPKGR